MGGRRPAPRVINTPTGSRRPREDSGDTRRDRVREPRRESRPKDILRGIRADDMPEGIRKRREETSGDSFRESRRERRRMAGDRRDYFGRVRKGFFGRVPKRPAPDTRDRKPIENFTGTMGMADGSPELIRKRKEAFEKKVNNLSPERRKEFDENRLRFRFTEEEGGRPPLTRSPGYTINFRRGTTPEERKRAYEKYRPRGFRPFPERNQDQNIAKTDV